jgi:hypothetical protein
LREEWNQQGTTRSEVEWTSASLNPTLSCFGAPKNYLKIHPVDWLAIPGEMAK